MKYPTGICKNNTKEITYGNRGMNLEGDLNLTNEYYLINNIASIYKKPTPIKIVKFDNAVGRIKDAFFETPSTTDYNGIYKGKYIDYEAKETNNLNFPLENIHAHQVKHLTTINKMGGIGFIIVYFKKVNEVYMLSINEFNNFINTNTRKSIPLEYFKNKGYKIEYKYNPRLDYLKIIDKLFFKEEK